MAKILTVDDYEPSLYAHARVLRGAGFDVVEATDGRTALEIAEGSFQTSCCWICTFRTSTASTCASG